MVRKLMTVIVVLAIAMTATGCSNRRVPNWLEIPNGYRGYLVVEFSNPSCPLLERRGEYEVIRFGEDGRACASDRYEDQEGIATDRFFYFHPDGHLTELTYQDVNFGTMYGTVSPPNGPPITRLTGSVFAPAGGNAIVNYAMRTCAWSDSACWKPLRMTDP
jgi:hypothetical protein